jgi:hypothetical protein
VITDTDMAELMTAVGNERAAAHYREAAAPDPDAVTADDLADLIEVELEKVPNMDRGKHNATCWTTHAACLADHLRELLP